MRTKLWGLSIGVLALALGGPARVSATTANDLCAPSADPCVVSTMQPVTHMSIIDVGNRELRIAPGGALDVVGGTMTLRAATLNVQNLGAVRARGGLTSRGGTINVEAGAVTIAGVMDASGAPAGTITVTVTGAFTATGSISAGAMSRSELGGTVSISAESASISGPISVIGGFDSIGGDFTLETTGTTEISGSIDTSGGDAGDIEISAGTQSSGGNVTINDAAVLRSDATTAGGFGAGIDVSARGDGIITGFATVNGLLSAKGLTGTEDIGGGSGGCIDIFASGDIHVDRAGARLTTDGGAPDGDGGEVDFTTDNGSVTLQGTVSAAVAGPASAGGSVGVDAATDVTINGSIVISAGDGDGGDATVSSATGSVTVGPSALIDVTSTSAGDGGEISIESGFGAVGIQSVLIQGRLTADGGPNGGGGGAISLTGGDAVRVAPTGTLRGVGTLGGGRGGTVDVTADPGSVSIEGPILVSGASPNGQGGIVSVEAVCGVSITAPITASGFGVGGQVGFATDTGPIDLLSNIDARSTGSMGGSIEVAGVGDVRVAGSLQTDGTVAPGGRIQIAGCDVTICGLDAPHCPAAVTAILSSAGPGGMNRITGRDSTAILGTMRANQNDGRNELVYDGSAERAPFIPGGATVTPAPIRVVDNTLEPCPVCGDNATEDPETCDDGNTNDGDGCSSCCQNEVERIPGDANGDTVVAVEDVRFLITEIFDGDGDAVGNVSSGSFRGAPGADANGDGHINAADITTTIKLVPR